MRFKRLSTRILALGLSFTTMFTFGNITSFANVSLYQESSEYGIKDLDIASPSEAILENLRNVVEEDKLFALSNLDEWVSEDFTYELIPKKIVEANEYFAISGLSKKGKIKIKKNKNLVIPAIVSIEEDGIIKEQVVQGIGREAFSGLELESLLINIPQGYKEYVIDAGAFSDNKLKEIEIPYGIKFIEAFAFKDNEIEELNVPETVARLGNESFANNNIGRLVISDQVSRFQFDSFSFANNKLTEVELPYNIFKLLANVFYKNVGKEDGKVLLYTRNKKHLETSTYISPYSDYHKFELIGENIDRENLYKSIERALTLDEADYTEQTAQKLTTCLEKAKIILAKHDSTKEDIEKAKNELDEAILALEFKGVNKKELKKVLESIKDIKPNLYTLDSFNKLSRVMTEAQTLIDSEMATLEQVSDTLERLKEAKDKLVIKEEAKYKIGDFTYDETTITGFSDSGKEKFKYNKDLILPRTSPTGEKIKEIGDKAFAYTANDYIIKSDTAYSPNGLDSVDIPDTVESIGKEAFKANKIKSILLPNGLKSIGDSAFNGNVLESVSIPDSVIEIGYGAFSLNRITSVKLSNTMKIVPKGIFSRNISLEHIDIPLGVEIIDDGAFVGCPLYDINIPNTVKEIGNRAFLSHRIENLYIPDSVKSIGKEAFASNKKYRYLKNIILSEGLEKIGAGAFKSSLVEEIYIPNSIKVLDAGAFNDNMNLKKELIKTKVYTNNPKHMEDFKSTKFELILKKIDIGELEKEKNECELLRMQAKYIYASEDKKSSLDEEIAKVNELLNNPSSQVDVDKHIEIMKKIKKDLDGIEPKNITKPREDKKEIEKEKVENKKLDKKDNNSLELSTHYSGGGTSSFYRVRKVTTINRVNKSEEKGKWVRDDKGWWYLYEKGTYPKSEWKLINSKWYYFDKNGYMAIGWLYTGSKWYYLDESGAMLSNTFVGKYKLGNDGAWIE